MWFILDMTRYKQEQAAVRKLESEVDWLVGVSWRLDSSHRLCFHFELTLGPKRVPLTLRYGSAFPATPPTIFPDPPQRLSEHQYGGTGDLCLEYGADTWLPGIHGDELIRSAHRLLSGEAAAALDPLQTVPSRHELTIGQATRNDSIRLMVTVSLQEYLSRAPRGNVGVGRFRIQYNGAAGVFLVASITGISDDPWIDPELPDALTSPASLSDGTVFGVPSGIRIPTFGTREDVDEFVRAHGGATLPLEVDLFLLYGDSGTRLVWVTAGGDVLPVTSIVASEGRRMDIDHGVLLTKSVGIVGCGSVGSKLASMLARAGVVDFVLVDDDIFLPQNIVRNELSWTDVGQHKADALAARLKIISSRAKCVVRKHRVGGQESNSVADSSILLLQTCALVIDASASAAVFNVLSNAVSPSRPMVWAEVFAGGIGGLIARCRPGVDPPPQVMRASIEGWCAEKNLSPPRPIGTYGAEAVADQSPWIADDADVTVIAAHAARIAIDLLLDRTPSWFSSSAYLIGLSPAWLFSAPFDTYPIDFDAIAPALPPGPIQRDPETLSAILKLFAESSAQPTNPS